MPKDNIVSDNLPTYFIWFGSDIPPKYFDNLENAANKNKSRDIILVYSEKHLLKNKRKNIDSMESMSIDKIQKRVKLKAGSRTKNLWKIDVYDMKLDEQDNRIYSLFDQIFTENKLQGQSYPFCAASDIIRLPLLNITGGIYLDMDHEVNGKIKDIECKKGFNFYFQPKGNDNYNVGGHILTKSNVNNGYFNTLMKRYFDEVSCSIENPNPKQLWKWVPTDPACFLIGYIVENFHHKVSDQEKQLLKQTIMSDYGIKIPSTIKPKMEVGEGYNTDYNNPEQLKKLGLDRSSALSDVSLEQVQREKEISR